jgi:hypothetical protein
LTEPPIFAHLWCAGTLYRNFGLLSDIVDAYPVDYGANAEMITAREIRDAARDWLGMPRTVEGMEQYLIRWDARFEAYRRPTERPTRHRRTTEPASRDSTACATTERCEGVRGRSRRRGSVRASAAGSARPSLPT